MDPGEGGEIVPAGAGGATGEIGARELAYYCGPHDLKRLELYSRNLVSDLIRDCVRALPVVFFRWTHL